MSEEQNNIVYLHDEEGNEIPFEFLDLIPYEGQQYVVMLPVEGEDGQVVILRVEALDDDEENEAYCAVESEQVLTAVFEIFREKYKDLFEFEG